MALRYLTKSERFKLPVLPQLGLLAVILLLIFSGAVSAKFSDSDTTDKTDITTSQPSSIVPVVETDQDDTPAFSTVSITGKAAYVWDVNAQKAYYKKNESDQLPLASLTKLMTALVAHELLGENDTITISETAMKQDGVSSIFEGETFNRLALSDLTLLESSNDGAYALAYAAGAVLAQRDPANAFVQAMNIRAKEIGLSSTYFKNPTGLDISTTEGGAYGTARDMAFLMEYIIENEPTILNYTKDREIGVENTTGLEHEVENTNYYVDEIPGLIGSKTGFTDLAGGNLVVAFDVGLDRPIIVVVLGSSRQERFSDVITLVKEVQKYIKQS